MYILQESLFSFDELQKRFRYQCGLRLDRESPSVATLSRVFAELTNKGLAKRLFEDLVTRCKQEGIIVGSHVAIDSAAIHAYEKKQPTRLYCWILRWRWYVSQLRSPLNF